MICDLRIISLSAATMYTFSSWDMIGSNLAKMREESYLCDFKIAASDFESTRTLIFAHSVVMAASCSKFYNSLVTNHTKLKSAQTFVTSEVSTSVLSIAVDFIYGTLPVDTDGIEALGKAADILGIPTAKKYIKSLEKKVRQVSKTSKLTKDVPELSTKSIVTVKLLNSADEKYMKEMMRTSLNFSDVKCLERKVIYSCPVCDMIYKEQLELINHLNACHRLSQCPLCFVQLRDSTSHFLKEHPVIKSLCYTQHETFEEDPAVGTTSSIRSNIKEINSRRKVKYDSNSYGHIEYFTRHCKVCREEFPDTSYLREHLINTHHFVKCTHCHATISYKRFPKHLQQLHSDNYTCCRCEDTHASPVFLLDHIHKAHDDKEVYFCSVCAFNTPVISDIIEHFAECHGILAQYTYLKGLNLVLTKFNLQRVPALYGMISGENYNMELKTNWLKNIFFCCCCTLSYDNVFHLCACIQTHLEDNYPIYDEEKPYNCWKCEKSFSDLPEYERHSYYHKKKQCKYMCDICGYGTNVHTTAQVHANVHAGIRPYQCNMCDRAFSHIASLNVHTRVHSKETRMVCQICGMQFKYTNTFNSHMKRVHDPSYVPPFSCTLCEYKTHTNQQFERHMKYHGGIRDVICSICGKGSICTGALRKHMRQVHKVKYSTKRSLTQIVKK